MSHDTSHKASNGAPGAPHSREEDEISLLDILVVFARKQRIIVGSVALCLVLGLAVALASPAEYTSEATVVRELDDGSTTPRFSGLAALQGLGLSLGGSQTGISTEAFPDILRSREVRLAVVHDTFYVSDLGRSMTFVEYANREADWGATVRDYTIRLPWTVARALRSAEPVASQASIGGVRFLTEEEERAVRLVDDLLSTAIDRENGLMTISVTTGDATLSAGLTESFSSHLSDRVRAMRTEKARRNLSFIEERFEEAQAQLQEAEAELARFLDRNRNIATAQLENERDRLRRQVSFSEQLYSEIQTQITQAEIELQRSEPVITVVEEPVASLRPSGPRRTLIVLLSFILGLFLGVGAAFIATAIDNSEQDEEERDKLQEIREAFSPSRLLRRYRKKQSGTALSKAPEDVSEG